ncbi:acyl-phosphate glycerol 3-phosphate acyltransferase [Marinifilum breve]|uniref:Glycerol-3-phosphate acyltransferase n=1 Tax=Marinifilum breve TaxID=2184082 RepID=A0A2V3ZW92_9BACT|nr:glycerol-3-phosphate 1-O-acyltransferase PlsY [Marinifilum breve]PXX96836.1 acyl-phosphate glycerol 3-phosphate acyltransferase [Marinifilum breve]
MTFFWDYALILIAYMLGSFPAGYVYTKISTGKDIRNFGSGNIGSTNVKRIAGSKISIYTQITDMAKGLLPVLFVLLIQEYQLLSISQLLIYFVALATILGHNFSFALKFKGGKGVNTTLGASVLIAPISVFISVAIYFIVKKGFKFVSLGSMAIAICLPLSAYFLGRDQHTILYLLACSLFIFVRHTANIKRLFKGTELR